MPYRLIRTLTRSLSSNVPRPASPSPPKLPFPLHGRSADTRSAAGRKQEAGKGKGKGLEGSGTADAGRLDIRHTRTNGCVFRPSSTRAKLRTIFIVSFSAPVRQNPNTVPSALPFSRIDHAAERTQTNWVATLRHKAPFTVPGGAAAHDLFGALCTERETEVARKQACLPTIQQRKFGFYCPCYPSLPFAVFVCFARGLGPFPLPS